MEDIIIIGGGIGGLALALSLHEAKIPCRVYEAAPEIKALGVGINILPHACRILTDLGLQDDLRAVAVETKETLFHNHHGQLIYGEPCGLDAGYNWPQFSIHRGDLHMVLYHAALERLGPERVITGHKCVAVEQDGSGVTVFFEDGATGAALGEQTGRVAIACDGFHSIIRQQFYPDEGGAVYSGINMWRGVTRQQPFLTGASMARAGALKTGKIVIYPIRNNIDDAGNQLINWVAELESDTWEKNDWSKPGKMEDFFPIFKNWHFDWLDVATMMKNADYVLEYPMVDRDPIPKWSFGRITLMGDAAHPMYPRGSNGAAQAIIDAECLTGKLREMDDPEAALKSYEDERCAPTAKIVETNRTNPPDHIINTVEERTGGAPFDRLEDVISAEELAAISENYKRIAGYTKDALNERVGG